MGPTSAGYLVAWAAAGLLLGRLARPVVEWLGGTAPVVVWPQPLALGAVALTLGLTARATHRAVRPPPASSSRLPGSRGSAGSPGSTGSTVGPVPLTPQRAVNRLLLARACAVVGALVAGAYLGYALAWAGSDALLADQRVLRSLVTALAGAAVVVAALALERACRVPPGEPEP